MINFKIKSIVFFLYFIFATSKFCLIIFFPLKNLFAILNITKVKILWNISTAENEGIYAHFIYPSIHSQRNIPTNIFLNLYIDSSAREEDESSSHTLGVYANSLALSHFVHIRCMYVSVVT